MITKTKTLLLISLVLLLYGCTSTTFTHYSNAPTVVLLHGLFRTPASMNKLAHRINKAGYNIVNIGYKSTQHTLPKIVDDVYAELKSKNLLNTKLHFVGYSMGGLVVRGLLNNYNFNNLGNVVLIGTPNQGTLVANNCSVKFWCKFFLGKSVDILTTTAIQKLQPYLGTPNYNIGLIAGTSNKYYFFTRKYLTASNDGMVPTTSVKISNVNNYIQFNTNHNYLIKSQQIANSVVYFLQNNTFNQ